jgi:hypothetical protein
MLPLLVFRLAQIQHSTLALLALVTLLLPGLAVADVDREKRFDPYAAVFEGPVPKARCGPGDRPETGLQGQTTTAERESGASAVGFNCNLELVGQFEGEGASCGFAWFEDCAYYGTGGGRGAPSPLQVYPGVVVLDVSNPKHPRMTATLTDPAMLEPWESLKVNPGRKLLGATRGLGQDPIDRYFAFYDISDCAHPVVLSVPEVVGHLGHAGNFAPDGRTYYGTWTIGPTLTAMDISTPSLPNVLLIAPYLVHDLSVSADGTRGYLAQNGSPNSTTNPTPNGLVIADLSDIQFRRPNPQIRTISTLFWNDGATAQQTLPIFYRSRPYLIFTDEHGSGSSSAQSNAAKQYACSLGLPPNGFARIIDISDERNPRVISKMKLEIGDPANCAAILNNTPDIISSSSHYCGVDRISNPRLLACTHREAGLRVFNIKDPFNPREIAYYKPRARRMEVRPGSVFWGPQYANGGDRTTDQTPSQVRFKSHNGQLHLWFTSEDNGFQIVRFTHGVLRGVLDADEDEIADD